MGMERLGFLGPCTTHDGLLIAFVDNIFSAVVLRAG